MASDSQSGFISYRRDEIWWAPAGIVMLAAIASLYGLFQVINSGPPGFAGGQLSDIKVSGIKILSDGTEVLTLKFNAVIKGYLLARNAKSGGPCMMLTHDGNYLTPRFRISTQRT